MCPVFKSVQPNTVPVKLPVMVQVSVVAVSPVGVLPDISVKLMLLPLPTFAATVALRLLMDPLVVTNCAQTAMLVEGVHGPSTAPYTVEPPSTEAPLLVDTNPSVIPAPCTPAPVTVAPLVTVEPEPRFVGVP